MTWRRPCYRFARQLWVDSIPYLLLGEGCQVAG